MAEHADVRNTIPAPAPSRVRGAPSADPPAPRDWIGPAVLCGVVVANVVGSLVDLKPRVEDAVIEKLRASLAEQGVNATVERQDD